MNQRLITRLIALLLPVLVYSQADAADWRALKELRGLWSFTVGDDPAWADPKTNIADWDKINAPGNWERYYPNYNGYAWCRMSFDIDVTVNVKILTLFLGHIDDVDEVYINGRKIGQTGKVLPRFETAYSVERRYLVPLSMLKSTDNVIAVRVYDQGGEGGFTRASRFGFYYDADQQLMSVDLSGTWKFSTTSRDARSNETDDSAWNEIFVPMSWDDQGYAKFDGTAWYRKQFELPSSFKGRELYLALGKIDDFDKVYLNGEFIGKVEDLEGYSRYRRNESYRLLRIYRLPPGLLRSKNLLSVEVVDSYGAGGIYEGPVGIITDETLQLLKKRRVEQHQDDSWSSFVKNLLQLFD